MIFEDGAQLPQEEAVRVPDTIYSSEPTSASPILLFIQDLRLRLRLPHSEAHQ